MSNKPTVFAETNALIYASEEETEEQALETLRGMTDREVQALYATCWRLEELIRVVKRERPRWNPDAPSTPKP